MSSCESTIQWKASTEACHIQGCHRDYGTCQTWEVQYLGKGKGVMLASSQLSDRVGLKVGSHMRCVHRLLQHQSTHAPHSCTLSHP